MNKTLEKILEDELFDNEVFEGEGSIQIKNTSEGTKLPIILMGNTIQDGEPNIDNPVEIQNDKDSVNFAVCNKNLFKPSILNTNFEKGLNIEILDDGGIHIWGTSTNVPWITIKDDKKIIFEKGKKYRARLVDENGKATADIGIHTHFNGATNHYYNTNSIIDVGQNDISFNYLYMAGEHQDYDKIFYFSIEEIISDNQNFDYVKGKDQQFIFPLTEGQIFHKDDYLADNGIHQVKDDYIFTGDETIIYYSDTDIFYTDILSKFKKGGLTNYSTNYFKIVRNSDYLHLEDSSTVGQNKDGRIHFKAKEYKTADDFKALLKQWYQSGKPLKIEYELAEEKIIPYTPEQQKTYDKICQATAYNDTTNIICTDEIPCNFKVNAKISKIKKIKEQINAQIGA